MEVVKQTPAAREELGVLAAVAGDARLAQLLDTIPDGAEIEFLETDLPWVDTEEQRDKGNPAVLFKVARNFHLV